MPAPTLTKSHFLAFHHCPRRLWLALHHPDRAAPPNESARRRMRLGQQVDRHGRRAFGPGTLIPLHLTNEERADATLAAVQAAAPAIFQGTFIADDLLVQVDIMERLADGTWHLIEIKSSSSYKRDEHLPDAAYQRLVVERAGVPVTRVSVMHINKECRYPDLDNLLASVDITEEAAAYCALIEEQLREMRQTAADRREPDLPIGKHCLSHHRRRCDFHGHCWRHIDGRTIYEVPHLNGDKINALEAAGIVYLDDIPVGFEPGHKRAAGIITLLRDRRQEINRAAIRRALAQLRYPLYFFDFETIDEPIPRYPDAAPYTHIPFQYSCHVLQADGTLVHRDFLHLDRTDPRPPLIEAMLADLGREGTIVAYNIGFEKRVIRHLAAAFPDFAGPLKGLLDRFWDQLPIFRNDYRDYRCGGSASLKNVLPVVVPELTHTQLEVQNGSQAQVVWEELVELPPGLGRDALAEQLRAYCHLDTLAMVEIHKVLENL